MSRSGPIGVEADAAECGLDVRCSLRLVNDPVRDNFDEGTSPIVIYASSLVVLIQTVSPNNTV